MEFMIGFGIGLSVGGGLVGLFVFTWRTSDGCEFKKHEDKEER